MTNESKKPKRFGETAAAQVDTTEKKRVAISTYVGEELLLRGWRWASSENGEYMIIRIQRHGQPSEEVNCGSEGIMRQMQAFTAEELQEEGVIAWLHQAQTKYGKGGALWFADEPPSKELTLRDAPVGERGN